MNIPDTAVRRISTHVLYARRQNDFACSQAWYASRSAMLVEVETVGGLVEWGEAFGPAAISAAVVGLMVDANHACDVADAFAYARACADLDLQWFEKPVIPEDLAGYAEVRCASTILVAGGEAAFTRFGFRDMFMAPAVDIAQPDAMAVGGITECKRVFDLASAFGMRCNPPVWGTGIGLAASLQLLAVLPHSPSALQPREPMLEFDCTEHPIRPAVLQQPVAPVRGRIAIPTGPGLGIEVDRSALARFRPGP